MEFFGLTYFGPQNYIRDSMIEGYEEPLNEKEVKPLMEFACNNPNNSQQRPEIETIRLIDCYIGRVNGFAYGSMLRFKKMKRKGVIKPLGPADIYRLPPTSSVEYGWWQYDPALVNLDWYKTVPHRPQPSSPNTLILDKVRKNNKYATLF